MSLRIVHLGKYYHPHSGGIETHVRTLAQIQSTHGDEVHVVCIAHDPVLPAEFWDGPVLVRRFQPRLSFAKLDWIPELSRYLDELHCDLLHVHVPNPAMILAVLGMRRRHRTVVSYHSDVIGMRLRKWLFHPFEQRLFSRAGAIAVTSQRMVLASQSLSAHRARVCAIPYGLQLDEYLNPSARVLSHVDRLRETTRWPIWLMCGRLVLYKGHHIGIEALQRLPGTLVVIGDGPLRAKLERQAAQLGVDARVRFLGRVADDELLRAHYRAATAFWFPSIYRSEAFGLAQVEAMASGCPVINTRIVGSEAPWVSLHEQTGLTVPVGDPKALASAAQRLLDDPQLREQFGRAGRERARQEFCHTVMHGRWSQVYRRCLNDMTIPRHETISVN
jgi:rhamnosyl/mannosyltransferase